MSLLPLRFKSTIKAFSAQNPIKAWHESGAYVDGVWTKVKSPEYTIEGVVLVLKPEDVQFYAQGNASQGGIAIHTLETLYICDIDRDGQNGKQSYIEWNGYSFKVVGTGFATPNSDFFTYHALQYTDYGNYTN